MSPSPGLPIPSLETERLILRGPDLSDFEAMKRLFADPDHARFTGGKPASGEEVWARLLRYMGHWTAFGFGSWSIFDKVSGAYMGSLGPTYFNRDIEHSLTHLPEFGWGLCPTVWGRGYASEALKAALDWSDQTLTAEAVFCIIDPDNHASHRLAEKMGFVEVERTSYHDAPTVVRRRPLLKG